MEFKHKNRRRTLAVPQWRSVSQRYHRSGSAAFRHSTGEVRQLHRRRHPMRRQPIQRQPNTTGIPDGLKTGMENLSGISLDHVKVRYNSPEPASIQAHAYARGSEIHLASGGERHLPHELGHIVQQAEGRVTPTTTVNGMAVNDSPALEREATRMGQLALRGG